MLNKELEFLNILYNDGSLNDSQLEVDIDESKITNRKQKKNTSHHGMLFFAFHGTYAGGEGVKMSQN